MTRRIFAAIILLCMTVIFISACDTREKITENQALSIVIKDLGDAGMNAADPHIHTGTYNDQKCYNIYITVNGESMVYIISVYGEILHKGAGGHSH